MDLSAPGHAHFIGLAGAGMSGVAMMLRQRGWTVGGSDEGAYDPVLSELIAADLRPIETYAAENIPPGARMVVIGNHARLRSEHVEVAEARRREALGELTVASFPEVLGEFARGKTSYVIAGSYGKTTTTGLVASIFRAAGRNPSWFAGAVPQNLPAGGYLGTGDDFVLEGDEYGTSHWDPRPKFCHYRACHALITSCAHDHVNVFRTPEDYVRVFVDFAAALPSTGTLVVCREGEATDAPAGAAACRVVTYAVDDPRADYRIGAQGENGFEILGPGGSLGKFRSPLLGRSTRQNVIGAVALAHAAGGVGPEALREGVACFRGFRRRQEVHRRGRIVVVEDLSSSGDKATAFLEAMAEAFPERRIVALFQPNTFSFRSRDAAHWYRGLFRRAERVLVYAPPPLKGYQPNEMTHEEILEYIGRGNPGCAVAAVRNMDETRGALSETLRDGDLLAIMTSGGLGGNVPNVLRWVDDHFPLAGGAPHVE